jgi:hypothetical protein
MTPRIFVDPLRDNASSIFKATTKRGSILEQKKNSG